MARDPLSVVVATRDRPGLLSTCLDALLADLADHDEVVVADSASEGAREVAQVVAARGARLVRCEVAGASLARNAGWRAARHALVAFVDDDVRVRPGWSDALVATASADGVGYVVGRTVLPEGTVDGTDVPAGRPGEVLDRANRRPVGGAGNSAVRREVLASVGGFDERLGPGRWLSAGEDLELFDRVVEAGWTGRYAHEAVAEHDQWRTQAQRRRMELAYGKGMGARVAAALRREGRAAVPLLADVLRLGGLLTLLRRARPQPAPAAEGAGPEGPQDSGGWLLPVVWRVGALLGLVVGLVRLPPRPPSAGVGTAPAAVAEAEATGGAPSPPDA